MLRFFPVHQFAWQTKPEGHSSSVEGLLGVAWDLQFFFCSIGSVWERNSTQGTCHLLSVQLLQAQNNSVFNEQLVNMELFLPFCSYSRHHWPQAERKQERGAGGTDVLQVRGLPAPRVGLAQEGQWCI